MMSLSIQVEAPRRTAVLALLAQSDAMMASLYPDESNHLVDLSGLEVPEVSFFVARCDGVIVGCGTWVRTGTDEAELRRNEAHLLRQHIDQVLAAAPNTLLVVYGDFNDTKNETALKEVMGSRNSPAALRDLWLKDDVGDHWTEYWDAADVYSRIDYILVSRNLLPAVDYPKSYINRSPYWNQASDHRAVVAAFQLDKIQ